jgi:voltage-gated potassium channel
VLSTVGFGDIAPVTTPARVATMVQMLLNIVVFGLAAKVIFGAVDVGLRRRAAEERGDTGEENQG